MIFFQSIRMALLSIIGNKIRSFLTMLGIIIGVSSVILIVSLGLSFNNQVTDQFGDLGTDLLSVNIFGYGAVTSMTPEEVNDLGHIPGVGGVSPTITGSVTAKNRNRNTDTNVEGVLPAYEYVKDFHVQRGRFLLNIDNQYRQKVALIGSETATKLFGMQDPVGRDIRLNGDTFTIVGLLKAKGDSLMGSNDNKILIPLATAERFLQTKGIQSFEVKARNPQNIPAIKEQLQQVLTAKIGDPSGFDIFDAQAMIQSAEKTTALLSASLAGIAGISLIVGGIGIMNIMIVSVNERTREIGIRKAIGAKKGNILLQFMIESIFLSTLGGSFGIGTGLGLVWIAGHFTPFQIQYAWSMVAISFAFSFIIGVLFGIIPANKAARLRPIHALRTD
ncbi:ABC transporter permease [Paenibacillus hunanensis]|uniref:ABC transport system permease protein n=1 Tax=Paenibacillus hunanensis TaxID=539262 RepID=A0ABU1J176_9BACL|nr:ABC transporter permease [Paenibacillus hunanensis]MDR6245249.1 putative ABC transport system permease protein [Paenibacillus hunanensis]GGJ26975.1 ABC transporter permease [Paenibacillus hunanensis]